MLLGFEREGAFGATNIANHNARQMKSCIFALNLYFLTSNFKQVKKRYLLLVAYFGFMLASCDKNTTTSPANNNTANTNTQAAEPLSGAKIAYVNIDTLAMRYDYYLERKDKLSKEEEIFAKRIQERELNLRSEYENFAKRAQAGLVSEIEMQKAQLEFQQKQQNLENDIQARREGILAQNQKDLQEVYSRIWKFLEGYKKERGYNIVLGYQAGSAILYAEPELDITIPVLDGLNAAFKAEKDSAQTAQ
jgi:outer membrane protein